MPYQVLRVQKLKSLTSVRRSLKHAFRTQDTPNADPSLRDKNKCFGAESENQAMAKIKGVLPNKLRKNGVVCVEHLITASNEWFDGKGEEEQNDYFKSSIEWLQGKWGKENVICGGIHRDEKTPHMYVYVIPKDFETGRLNCRKWLGQKNALSNMQTQFHEDVGSKYGLERGIKGSKATHKTLKKYSSEINEATKNSELLATGYQKINKKDLLKAASGIGGDIVWDAIKKASSIPFLADELKRAEESKQTERARFGVVNALRNNRERENNSNIEKMNDIMSENEALRRENLEFKLAETQRNERIIAGLSSMNKSQKTKEPGEEQNEQKPGRFSSVQPSK